MKDTDWSILKILYETRSMTRAAEALYMTQPALTKRIKAIEQEWGIEIVKRSSTGVTFTEDGRYMVGRANIMLDFLQEMRQHFAEHSRSRELVKIGVPNSFARLHMPKLLREYMNTYDALQFKTIPNPSNLIIQQLTEGTIDIGIICGDYPYMGEKVCLFEEQLYVVTPVGVRLEDIEQLPLIESYLNPMVKLMVDQWWKSHFGSLPHGAHSVPYSDIAIEMVENHLGVSFLFGGNWHYDPAKLQLIPIYDADGQSVTRKVWLMVSDRCFQSPALTDFVAFVERYYEVN